MSFITFFDVIYGVLFSLRKTWNLFTLSHFIVTSLEMNYPNIIGNNEELPMKYDKNVPRCLIWKK